MVSSEELRAADHLGSEYSEATILWLEDLSFENGNSPGGTLYGEGKYHKLLQVVASRVCERLLNMVTSINI